MKGFSVYSLFEIYCKSPLGKKVLKEWFLTPSFDIVVIQERLQAVEILRSLSNQEAKSLSVSFSRVNEFEQLINRLTFSSGKYEYWNKLV